MREIHVAAIQTGAGSDDTSANVARALDLLDQAADERRLDLVVFNELFNTRFFAVDKLERFDGYFEPIPGPTTALLAEAARRHGTNIIAGIAEKASTGRYYNSAALIDRQGEVAGIYRKTHVPLIAAPAGRETYERNYFSPGDALPVFELDFGRVGVLICYDRHFPEAFRALSLQGAEVIAVPSGARSWNANWRGGIWEALLRTMAYVNGVFIVAVNRAGVEEQTTYTGDSMLVSPVGGQILARAGQGDDNCAVLGRFDLEQVTHCAESTPFRRDLRPELYAAVAAGPSTNGVFAAALRKN